MRPIEKHLLVIGTARDVTADRQGAERVAVIGEHARDDLFFVRAAFELVIHQREFDRGLDRLRTAAGKEEMIESGRGPSREALAEALAIRRVPDRQDVVDAADDL